MDTQKRFFYALSDSFTGDYPKEYTAGFANTKCAIAFPTKESRDEWLEATNLLTAKPLTRVDALGFAAVATTENRKDVLGRAISFGDRYVPMVEGFADEDGFPQVVRLRMSRDARRM